MDDDNVEIDEEILLKSTSEDLNLNEKVYLALFIFIQERRMNAFNDQVSLPTIKRYSVVKSTFHTFDKQKALMVNDFNDESSESIPTMLCRNLEAASKTIIALHIQQLRFQQANGLWSNHESSILVDDFNNLVCNSCS